MCSHNFLILTVRQKLWAHISGGLKKRRCFCIYPGGKRPFDKQQSSRKIFQREASGATMTLPFLALFCVGKFGGRGGHCGWW